MEIFHTLSIEHNKKLKKFQWRKSYSVRDFKTLLSQVFNITGEILGIKDRQGNIYEIDFFCKYPQELKPQVYYLLIEQTSSFLPGSTKKNTRERPYTQQIAGESEDLKSEFLFFLGKLSEEGLIYDEDYYFVKCMFFEQSAYILSFTREALYEKNLYKFHAVVQDLVTTHKRSQTKSAVSFRSPQSFRLDSLQLQASYPNPSRLTPQNFSSPQHFFEEPKIRAQTPVISKEFARNVTGENHNERPKSPYVERSREIIQFIETKARERLEISEQELLILYQMVTQQRNETILSSFEVYLSNKDEEDFVDTIKRVLNKIRSMNNSNSNSISNNSSNSNNLNKSSSYFVSKPQPQFNNSLGNKANVSHAPKQNREEEVKRQVNEEKRQVINEKPPIKVTKPPQQNVENTKKSQVSPPVTQVSPPITQVSPPVTQVSQSNNRKKDMLDLIFKTFFEETEEEFEPLEVGFAKYLYSLQDPALITILNTCETIPKAVTLVKELAVQAYMQFFTENFEPQHVEYIMKNRLERASEICSIIHNFKTEGKVDHLKKVLQAVVLSKTSALPEQKLDPKGNKYSRVAVSRSKNKKTSFRMMLHRETAALQNQTVNLKADDSDLPLIVTMNQEENPELRAMLNSFYEQENVKELLKNQNLMKDLIQKSDFLDNEQKKKLQRSLEENNFEILMILSKFERLNNNVKKVKTDITNFLQKELSEDLSGSPIIKKKRQKFNTFKQTINSIYEKYRLISQKQVKLYQYLYMEEDLAILGAYEVYLSTYELQDFIENLVIIDKYHYFKTKLDFDEIEQFNNDVEKQLELLFIYKKYLTNEQKDNMEKIIRAGDEELLLLYNDSKKSNQANEEFIQKLQILADHKTNELRQLEQKIKENRTIETIEQKRLDTIDTFLQSKFLKKCKHMGLITELVEQKHKIIDSLFSIYEMNKDKADFIENLTLVHDWAFKENYRKIIRKLKNSMNLKNNQINFLFDCIEFDMPNIMSPYEIYMLDPENPESEEELRESIRIILNVYVKEIYLLEKKYY